MTSMFDQYNTTLKREEVPSKQIVNTAPTSSGYVSVRTKEETPIFTKRKMPINLPNDILFTRVSNNWLVILMSDNVLLRLYLVQSDRQDGKNFRFSVSILSFRDCPLISIILSSYQRYFWRNISPVCEWQTYFSIQLEIIC